LAVSIGEITLTSYQTGGAAKIPDLFVRNIPNDQYVRTRIDELYTMH
jgi:hypothetical protein